MKIRPSNLACLALCPKFARVDNPLVTDAGTLMHEAIATGNYTGLSESDKGIAEGALAFAEQEKASLAQPVRDFVEKRVYCKALDLGGTVDRLMVGADGTAIVLDWKTGLNMPDDADDSLQVQAYMLGVLDDFPDVHTALGVLTNPRTQSTSVSMRIDRESKAGVTSRILSIIQRADDPFSAPVPGSHCARCRHSHRCWALVPTIRASAVTVLPGVLELLRDPTMVTPPPEIRSARAVLRSILERWCDAVKDADNEYLKQGNDPPPGFKRMIRSTGLRIPENERLAALHALRAAGIDDSIIAAGCNLALGKIIEAMTLVVGDKKEATALVQGAVAGIAVEGTTEYLTRDRKGVDDATLVAMLRKALPSGVEQDGP